MHNRMMDVARKIAVLRGTLKLKQAGFADLLEVTQSTVSRWESGKQEPRADELLKLAKVAGKTIDEFLAWDPPEPKDAPEPDDSERLLKDLRELKEVDPAEHADLVEHIRRRAERARARRAAAP